MDSWHLLITLYGVPGKPIPLLSVLSHGASSLVYGSTVDDMKALTLGADCTENDIRQSAFDYEFRPYSHAVFGSHKVPHLDVPTRRSTLYHWSCGQFVGHDENGPLKDLLNLNNNGVQQNQNPGLSGTASGGESGDLNYKTLINQRVLSNMSGKWSSLLGYLGFQNTFVVSSKSMAVYGWLVYYAHTYYLLFSSSWDTAKRIEEYTLENLSREASGTYYHQSLELPPEPLLILRPVYLTGKFRKRLNTYEDRASSKLLVCNYIRRYIGNLATNS